MAIITGTTVDWTVSPRIITIPAPITEVTMADLQDTLLDLEATEEGIVWPFLRNFTGGESLGGGVAVGFTMELQNAQLAFEARTTRLEEGTETTGSTDGITLVDSAATFQSNGVARGDLVFNTTDLSQASVVDVLSETSLIVDGLAGGTDNLFQSGDGYVVYDVVTCDITGGNLVAVDGVGAELSPTFATFGTQINRTSSSSATLQELADIQFASFQGGVWYDATNGIAGTEYPTGTERQPVDNFTDALTIATERGFNTFFIRGDATVDTGLDYTDYVFEGQGQNLTTFNVTSAAIVTNATFLHGTLTGTLDGDSQVEDCIIDNLDFVSGVIENCILNPSTVTLGGSETAHFIDCESGVPGTGTPVIDCGGSGQPLAMRGYNGGVKLINKTGTDSVSIDLASGQVRIDLTTVTNGTVVVRGVGKVVDDSDDSTLVSGTYGSLTLINETVSGIMVQEIYRILGLEADSPMTVTPTSRVAGDITQVISGDGETTTTVTRQ